MCLGCLGSRRGPGWTKCRVSLGCQLCLSVLSSHALQLLGQWYPGLGSRRQETVLFRPVPARSFSFQALHPKLQAAPITPVSCSQTCWGSLLPSGWSPHPAPRGTGSAYHLSCLPALQLDWVPSLSWGSLPALPDMPFLLPLPSSAPSPGLWGASKSPLSECLSSARLQGDCVLPVGQGPHV